MEQRNNGSTVLTALSLSKGRAIEESWEETLHCGLMLSCSIVKRLDAFDVDRSEKGDEANGYYREVLDMPADLRGARPAFAHHEGRVGLSSLQAGAEPASLEGPGGSRPFNQTVMGYPSVPTALGVCLFN
jgi:hypothetical protein